LAAARLYQRKWLLIKLPIALLALGIMAWVWARWLPMPPTSLSISTGRTDGAYHASALAYQKELAARGIALTVLESEGSAQNLARLRGASQPPADLAFVQGGAGYPGTVREPGARVQTLARVDIEPLWIFSRIAGLDSLQQLQGQRVSLGDAGSGTRRLAVSLLEQVRLTPRDLVESNLQGLRAVDGLRQGLLDVAVFVAAPTSPVVQAAVQAPGVHLVQLRMSGALTERLPYLQPRLLPQGSLDAGARNPPRDTTMLVTVSSLVARADLHPALQRQVADVARRLHAGPGLFHRAGEFPSLRRIEFPGSGEARRTLAHGLPWLERHLPFWWAQVAWRLLVVCLPVALVACWFARMVPAYLRWVVESRVARWYGELKYIEDELSRETLSGLDLSKYVNRLNDIERRMSALATPAYLMPRWFTLRQHIDFVRLGLFKQRGR
jgi:TRAP transporter TAXI family solute receptor